jgi:hypothetical protein
MQAVQTQEFQGKALRNDNVFVKSEVLSMTELTGLPVRRGCEKAIISEGQLVNVVSQSYGHLPNENYYYNIESKMIDSGIEFTKKSTNRENRSFAVDYILKADKYVIKLNGNEMDILAPMLRFVNSYDGSARTSGHFSFYRQVCSNGLHVTHREIGFSVMHRGNNEAIILPKLDELIEKFISNEFYTLSKKFEVMGDRKIDNLEDFVKMTAEKTKLFVYPSSEKNPAPSANARKVLETIAREASLLNIQPNHWLAYNAFNELIHDGLKLPFDVQRKEDEKVFNFISELN